jgi:deazaflavin-dependent oxidoreductase (nitroreductase family)
VSKPPPPDSRFWKLFGVLTGANTKLFRATNGRIGGGFGKARILLLHHVGRKSGQQRVTPLLYLRDGDRLVIVASKGGSEKHPAWFHNLMANPDTTVELPGEKRGVRARRASDDERTVLWPRLVDMYGSYESYQGYTDRKIPLVILEKA